MYEIIVAINGKEYVADTRADLLAASQAVSWYRSRRLRAFYRALVSSPASSGGEKSKPSSYPGQPRVA